MEVILKKDVDNLGFELEVVSVKPGYGRNFLIPQGLAELATKKSIAVLEETIKEREADEKAVIDAANKIVEKIKAVDLKLTAKVGEGDKLFGSINNQNIADALVAKGVAIEKKNIKIPGNTIKRLGAYTAKIKLHRSVEIDFEFEIQPEMEVKKKK